MKVRNKTNEIVSVVEKTLYKNDNDYKIGLAAVNRHIIVNDICNDWSTEETPEFIENAFTTVLSIASALQIPAGFYYLPQKSIDLFVYMETAGMCKSEICQISYFITGLMLTVVLPMMLAVAAPIRIFKYH